MVFFQVCSSSVSSHLPIDNPPCSFPLDGVANGLPVTSELAPSPDRSYGSQTFPPPEKASAASPPTSSSTSPRYDGSQLDGESDADCSSPSDADEEYRPTQATTSQKKRKAHARVKSTHTTLLLPGWTLHLSIREVCVGI